MPGDNYRTDGKQMIRTGAQYRDSIRDGRTQPASDRYEQQAALVLARFLLTLRHGIQRAGLSARQNEERK
jgi:hypothetical protein